MEYREELHWIVDKPGTPLMEKEAEYRISIDFVHSLGLKCDVVGWCRIDLAAPGTEQILTAIGDFCREKGWRARGLYTRTLLTADSDWYELVPAQAKDSTIGNWLECTTDEGEPLRLREIKAFYESAPKPKSWGGILLVPDRFRRACEKLEVRELSFCWARDKGKYAAEQYFYVFGQNRIPRVGLDWGFKHGTPEEIRAAGGWLPRVAEVFDIMQQISLPDCYLREDLPEAGAVHVYIPTTNSRVGKNKLLLHRDLARKLMEEHVLSAGMLRPVLVADELPGGYTLRDTVQIPRPNAAWTEGLYGEYEKLMAADRPVREMKEKDALKLLRQAKKERKTDFRKALPKAKAQALAETAYGPLVPYYAAANGGFLSDEFELLSQERAVEETRAFLEDLAGEELLEEKPQGVVIAKCPDGDSVLLLQGGTVVRFSHEAPEVTDQWPTLAQFVAESVQEGM